MRRRQRARTTRPDPNSSAAIPISHSSDSSAPVKAIAGEVLAGVALTGGEVPLLAFKPGVVAEGAVTTNEAGAVTATLPGTYVIV
jgi:hypothetical protein